MKLGRYENGEARKDHKVVWVLGAGFSRPLGLPLASELFTERFARLGQGFVAPPIYRSSALRKDLHPSFKTLFDFCKRPNPQNAPDLDGMLKYIRSSFANARDTIEGLQGFHPSVERHEKLLTEFEDAFVAACNTVAEAIDDWPNKREGAVRVLAAFEKDWAASKKVDSSTQWLETRFKARRQELIAALEEVEKAFPNDGPGNETMPEDILVSLDKAVRGDTSEQATWSQWTHKRGGVAAQAKVTLERLTKLIVAQLEAPMPRSAEKIGFAWAPYRRWVKKLIGPRDTIISFNYDRVVEKAFELEGRKLITDPGAEVDPGDPDPRLLKLHGSVTDAESESGEIEKISVSGLHQQVLGFDTPFRIRLGLPGETKSEARQDGGHLREAWRAADRAIMDADEFVFIGYRLPAEDVEAMAMIVDAMGWRDSRTKGREHTKAHLVLGPGVREADVIKSILAQHCEVFSANQWTQHALTTWERHGMPA